MFRTIRQTISNYRLKKNKNCRFNNVVKILNFQTVWSICDSFPELFFEVTCCSHLITKILESDFAVPLLTVVNGTTQISTKVYLRFFVEWLKKIRLYEFSANILRPVFLFISAFYVFSAKVLLLNDNNT